MSRRWYVAPATLSLSLLVAACDEPPTAPQAAARPSLAVGAQVDGAPIAARDLGVLPGDARSEATYITEGGVVYGRSYASLDASATPRFFKWTSAGGMVQVSSIPQPPVPPLPSLTLPPPPPQALAIRPFAVNAKGEATGQLCFYDATCVYEEHRREGAHVFRSSPGGVVVKDLDGRWFLEPVDEDESFLYVPDATIGWSINKWGHIAGSLREQLDDDGPHLVVWTPIDSFQFVGLAASGAGALMASTAPGDRTDMRINDLDQLMGNTSQVNFPTCAIVWRPDLGVRELAVPGFSCLTVIFEDPRLARAMAQQTAGTRVVGWARFGNGPAAHAALWVVPAVNRTAFPQVNANVYSTASTLRLASGGVRYYQTYKGTQATASGPYVELVDWGDGTSSRRTRSGIGVTTSQSHTYTKAGTFWVRVYVEDAQGRWGVSEHKVVVTG